MAPPELPPALLPWALSALNVPPKQGATLSTVAGDASNRRYFRLGLEHGQEHGPDHGSAHKSEQESKVLVHAPPASENNAAFVQVAGLLERAGVRVPQIEAVDLERGFMLLEDLGDKLLLPALNSETAAGHYQQAMDVLLGMAAMDLPVDKLRPYDETLLGEELGRFEQWFVTQMLDYHPNEQEQAMLQRLFCVLIDSAMEQPRVFVHRDFHSRNIMLMPADELAVIDFQDAVRGPITYDLASLLRDCYIRWPEQRVEDWALAYRDLLVEHKLLLAADDIIFLRWFDLMGLQRHIKVLGTFARLYLRDGKESYLADLPLVIDYVLQIAHKYAGQEPVFTEFADWFEAKLSPRIAQQPFGGAV